MSDQFSDLPKEASTNIVPFSADIEEEKLSELKTLLELSKLPPTTYETLREDGYNGVSGKWMAKAKDYWLNKFDW